jgi:predicted nucleic acid-binding protein
VAAAAAPFFARLLDASSGDATPTLSARRSSDRERDSRAWAGSNPPTSSVRSETFVTDVLCDASVVLKWFHAEGEADVVPARALLAAQAAGRLTVAVLDLTLYEIGNVLIRSLGWAAEDAADQLDDLAELCPVVAPSPEELRSAAEIAARFDLTFYDAAYAAVAADRQAALATADRALLVAGVAETPGTLVVKYGLSSSI